MHELSSQPMRPRGQGLLIYIIILAFIAMVVIGVMRLMSPKLDTRNGATGDAPQSIPGSVASSPSGSFDADDLYWNNPANGCTQNYTYGSNPACDRIIDKVHACLAGGTGSYCEDYFKVFPR